MNDFARPPSATPASLRSHLPRFSLCTRCGGLHLSGQASEHRCCRCGLVVSSSLIRSARRPNYFTPLFLLFPAASSSSSSSPTERVFMCTPAGGDVRPCLSAAWLAKDPSMKTGSATAARRCRRRRSKLMDDFAPSLRVRLARPLFFVVLLEASPPSSPICPVRPPPFHS